MFLSSGSSHLVLDFRSTSPMIYTEKMYEPGYDINLSIYALKIHIKDNLSNEVFFTPSEI